MESKKVVVLAEKVKSFAIALIGIVFFSWGTNYLAGEHLLYNVPRILSPVFDLFGPVGLAIGLLILGGGLMAYAFVKWKKMEGKPLVYWLPVILGLVVGIALANVNFFKSSGDSKAVAPVVAGSGNDIMEDILWGFSGGKYDSQKVFIEELVKYNLETGKKEINPDEIVIENKEVIISCVYENEDDDDDYSEEFRLTADNGKYFTLGELLFKIHNQVVEQLEDFDYHFFEGLIDNGIDEEHPDIPYYYLNLGS